MIAQFAEGQTARYSVVINEILADPSPIVGLPNTEFIELKNISNRPIQLAKWRIDNGNTSAVVNTSYLLQPDSLVILCTKTQTAAFNAPKKTIGLSSFPTLGNEGGIITLKDPTGKTIHAVEHNQSLFDSPLKSEGGWTLEMIDPMKACDPENWKASINNLGGTPGNENSIYKQNQPTEKINALQCTAINPNSLLLQLNKGADSVSLSSIQQYSLLATNIHITSANALAPLFKEVSIQLSLPLESNKIYQLDVKDIGHCNQAVVDSMKIKTGLIKQPEKEDLILNEILFNPETGGADFVEIYNKSNSIIDAKDVFLTAKNLNGAPSNTAYQASKDHLNIFPDEYIVLTTDTSYVRRIWPIKSAQLIQMNTMPSMPDDKGNIVILDKQGRILDEMTYTESMHFPLLTNHAGVSLERINTFNSSSNPNNWHSASSTNNYATPTRKNSQHVSIENTDHEITLSPEMISPNNDGIDDLLNIAYRFQHQGTLITIAVYDYNGRLITTIANNQLCGTSGSITWNGLDRKNQKPPSGIYIIYAETLNLAGKIRRVKKIIAIK